MKEDRETVKIIENSKEDYLYSYNFPGGGETKGKYLSIVRSENSAEIQISPRVRLRATYIYDKGDICGFEIVKIKKKSNSNSYEDTPERVNLSTASLGHIVEFADFIKSIDIKSVTQRRIKLSDSSFEKLDDSTKRKLVTALSTEDGQDIIKTLLDDGSLTSSDIVNIGYRKQQLRIFKTLLEQHNYWQEYGQSEKNNGENGDFTKEEKVWQHFFKKNPWIFGYGLDYRYLEILQHEAAIKGADISGKNEERIDVLMGATKYTVLVELKKPTTKIFEVGQNRSNSWRLSKDLIWATSQILEYKATHQVEWNRNEGSKYDRAGNKLNQQAVDPKAILIIGSDDMFHGGSDREIDIRKRTFELYRRDSRNIEIFTYSELYDRAKFIVNNGQKDNKLT